MTSEISAERTKQQEALVATIPNFRRYLDAQIIRPTGKDPFIASFAEGLGYLLDDEVNYFHVIQSLQHMFDHRVDDRPPLTAKYAFDLLLRCIMKQIIRPEKAAEAEDDNSVVNPFFPIGYDPSRWANTISTVLHPDFLYDGEVQYDLWFRDVMSNVSKRYVSLPIILNSIPERFTDGAVMLDVACSLNRGLKKYASGTNFDPIKVEDRRFVEDRFNQLAIPSIELKEGLGVDIMPMTDPATQLFAEACSLYPGERLKSKMVTEYQHLDSATYPSVTFMQSDFVADQMPWEGHPSMVDRFDVVKLFTFLYMRDETERATAIERSIRAAKDDGLVIVQDFATSVPGDPFQLKFYDDWTAPWQYETLVLDKRDIDKGFQPLFIWNNGRCEAMRINDAVYDADTELKRSLLRRLVS